MAKAFGNIKTAIESMDRVTFGIHSGNSWFWVTENFPDYIIWCVGNTDMKFSYDLIVEAIKSKYKKKAAAKSEERDLDQEANAHLGTGYTEPGQYKYNNAFYNKKPSSIYTGGLRGDQAHYDATQQQEANDKATDRWVGGKGWSTGFDDLDDIPF